MVMVEKTDMTAEMDQADKTVQAERLKTLPAADGFHMPGEFEPHKGTIMIWPERPGSWAYGAKYGSFLTFRKKLPLQTPRKKVLLTCKPLLLLL